MHQCRMTGYDWLLAASWCYKCITTFLAMHCEVFGGLGQVAVIDRRQCIQHNGLLSNIAKLAAASMISGLPSYGITIKHYQTIYGRLFSTFNLRKMCQTVSVKSSFKVEGIHTGHGSAITCGSSSSDFTSSSKGPGWLKPGPSTLDGEPSSPNSHNQRSDVWMI